MRKLASIALLFAIVIGATPACSSGYDEHKCHSCMSSCKRDCDVECCTACAGVMSFC